MSHVLMEDRNGLCTDALVSSADGRAEPGAALAMVRRSIDASRRRVTLGSDKGYDIEEFQVALVEEGVFSHVAQKEGITPVLDRRTTGRSGYRLSQRKRKRVEEIFGWAKTDTIVHLASQLSRCRQKAQLEEATFGSASGREIS